MLWQAPTKFCDCYCKKVAFPSEISDARATAPVFTQRFKRSGMRWGQESGQVILDLRLVYLSGIWEEAFARDLAARLVPEPVEAPAAGRQRGSRRLSRTATRCLAA